ncbi:MAG: Serine/threonine-protein kinase tel1 [Vezdaea aestivalis]|nr:MAG: Serine/threonine-protein kinase tel1 [Vezdaea aestivalis]
MAMDPISSSLEAIQTGSIKSRSEGLDGQPPLPSSLDLTFNKDSKLSKDISLRGRPILDYVSNNLEDKGYRNIFNAIKAFIVKEKQSFNRSINKSTNTSVSNRLSEGASTLRLTVSSGVGVLKYKTASSLLEFLTKTIFASNGTLCEPLSLDFCKTIHIVLAHTPHLEHLTRSEVGVLLEFCIDEISSHLDDGSRESSFASNNPGSFDDLQTFGPGRPFGTASSRGLSIRLAAQEPKHILESLLQCLECLVTDSTLNLSESFSKLMDVAIGVFQFHKNPGRAHLSALAIVNRLFADTAISSVSVSKAYVLKFLPILSQIWISKLASLKEQMIISWTYFSNFIESLILQDHSEDCVNMLENLYSTVKKEYEGKPERELLQLDDVSFHDLSEMVRGQSPFQLPIMSPYSQNQRGEHSLMSIRIMCTIIRLLDLHSKGSIASDILTSPQRSKRVKRSSHLDEVVREIKSLRPQTRTCAAQIIIFSANSYNYNIASIQRVVESLHQCMMEMRGDAISWTILAFSSLSGVEIAVDGTLTPLWNQIWQVASRAITVKSTCRAASHLLTALMVTNLCDLSVVLEQASAMFTYIDLNGPADFSDASILLWLHLVRLWSKESPNDFGQTSERLLQWIVARWNPSNFGAKSSATAPFQLHSMLPSVMNLILACSGESEYIPPRILQSPTCGPLGQAQVKHARTLSLQRYLLLIPGKVEASGRAKGRMSSALVEAESTVRDESNMMIGINFLASEFSKAEQEFNALATDQPQKITSDVVQHMMQICITLAILSPRLARDKFRQTLRLQSVSQSLTKSICDFLKRPGHESVFVSAILESVEQHLPEISLQSSEHLSALHQPMFTLCKDILSALLLDQSSKDESQFDPLSDEMDIDGLDSQASRQRNPKSSMDFPRRMLPALCSQTVHQTCMTNYIRFLAIVHETSGEDSSTSEIPTSFVDDLISLKPTDLIACGPLMRIIFGSGMSMSRAAACRLLQRASEVTLQNYDFERSEIGISFCLELLANLQPLWVDDAAGDSLADICADLHDWFISVALGRAISSSEVLISLAVYLQELLGPGLHIGKDITVASVRSSLLKVLQDGDLSVKFHISQHIGKAFDYLILGSHIEVYQEIVESLPEDSEWVEGLALRMLILGHLAASWTSLLRICVYHLFETPGRVPGSGHYARWCFDTLATNLGLSSSKEILKLFSRQILFTWIDSAQSFADIPFAIFGYDSLVDLLGELQDELTAQLFMSQSNEALQILSVNLGASVHDLLVRCFPRCIAYCLSSDVSASPNGSGVVGESLQKSESNLKKYLEEDLFLELTNQTMPAILFFLVNSLEREEEIEKAFRKHGSMGQELHSLRTMKAESSKNALSANQQPSFRAKYFLDVLSHLSQRSSGAVTTLWSSSTVVYVIRELIKSIKHPLGSLHACAVLRQIRLVIALAGVVCLRDYPLEMLLHALWPYLIEPHCADDAFGMVQYLLEHGRLHLIHNPSFVAGISVAILTSLRRFMKTTQATTTQESDHLATMSRAQSFHDWFGRYLVTLNLENISEDSEQAFFNTVKAARDVRDNGNAQVGTSESLLLLQLLDDKVSGRNLFNGTAEILAFSLLCEQFESPDSYHDDILGQDKLSVQYAVALWKSCKHAGVGRQYRSWAARSIGRAFASTGAVPKAMIAESNLEELKNSSRADADSGSRSSSSLLRLILDLLFSQNSDHVQSAENALQELTATFTSANRLYELQEDIPETILSSMKCWLPPYSQDIRANISIADAAIRLETGPTSEWTTHLVMAICQLVSSDLLLRPVVKLVQQIPGFAEHAFPFILHHVLLQQFEKDQSVCQALSSTLEQVFESASGHSRDRVKLIITAILYLRSQPQPYEKNVTDRDHWLSFDYATAAQAAVDCNMVKTALMFYEIRVSRDENPSRRELKRRPPIPSNLLLSIYTKIDEPDSFYGLQNHSGFASVLQQACHEEDGPKSLSMQAAILDANARFTEASDLGRIDGLINSFSLMDMNGMSLALLQGSRHTHSQKLNENLYTSARRLQQWNLPVPISDKSEAATIFRAFKLINRSPENQIRERLQNISVDVLSDMTFDVGLKVDISSAMRILAITSEIDDLLSCSGSDSLQETWCRMEKRQRWMSAGSFTPVSRILSCRETLFGSLARREQLQSLTKCSLRSACELEVLNLQQASTMYLRYGALQHTLTSSAYLSQLVETSSALGLDIKSLAVDSAASVLWRQGESVASVQLLKTLMDGAPVDRTPFTVPKSEVMTKLGQRISDSRMEKPDSIIKHYLLPAINELREKQTGPTVGRLFHTFASFCDDQLQNSDFLDELDRMKALQQQRQEEIAELENMRKQSIGDQAMVTRSLSTATKWHQLDNQEYGRLITERDKFLERSLEYYLKSLGASEEFNNDSLRFCALWLKHSSETVANKSVSAHLDDVASFKFAPLMNQLSSRLLDYQDEFSSLLFALITRICIDHPLHGLYQIFANSHTVGKDEVSVARKRAALKIINQVKKSPGNYWNAIEAVALQYLRFAMEQTLPGKTKPPKAGQKIQMREWKSGNKFKQELMRNKIPPPTMRIPLDVRCEYNHVPTVTDVFSEVTIAGGLSAPKIFSTRTSDGRKFKQLVKGGNDDLRQDAIMEQVFEQVSDLLQKDRATRQRNLRVRIYKVLPLSPAAGIIEFVADTIPLNDYLVPAHRKYRPQDWADTKCRQLILDAQSQHLGVRLRAFREATKHFHPVLRYFFIDRFDNPDDWFEKRISYSRSTAAISILGHILGLGDRHGHNILLDEKTGEVIHIDLGVAFEQGRILRVAETIPFRLTRDVVDGMGVTKTEGVFRRCCEFILAALRAESDGIMTVLDVLRYDPLYSWTMSPVRRKRIQEAQSLDQLSGRDPKAKQARQKSMVDEPSEADRALSVVKRKLSKGLSVAATVNELIQQASDEQNLAVVFAGWAAYM